MARTRKKIETASDIWEAAIADTPVDQTGPQWPRPEPPAITVWAVLGVALITNAAFVVLVVKIWDWFF